MRFFTDLLPIITLSISQFRAVANVLGNLKGVAQEMNNELERQNKQIDRLNDKTQNEDNQLKHINQRIQQQIK